jgi:hypothetical protein
MVEREVKLIMLKKKIALEGNSAWMPKVPTDKGVCLP